MDCIFLDCEKAFDRADHTVVLNSLEAVGVEPSLVALISDYLTDRKQVTMVDGVPSDEQLVTSGVPQGSILGPLLYIIMVDSVGSFLQSPRTRLKMFADDIVMYRTVCDDTDEKHLQLDLDNITTWASAQKLTFNSLKSIHVRFSSRNTALDSPAYFLFDSAIPQKASVKYLGLYLDSQLSWKVYVDEIVTKVNKRVRYINCLFPQSCQRARLVLFQSLVLPLFDHCAAVVHPQLKTLNDAMEKLVHAFLRTVNLGVPSDASPDVKYSLRLKQLGMEPLVIRRLKRALSMAYKFIFGRIPFSNSFFETFVPVAPASLVAGNTRRAHQRLQHPRPIQVIKKSDNAVLAQGSSSSATS